LPELAREVSRLGWEAVEQGRPTWGENL